MRIISTIAAALVLISAAGVCLSVTSPRRSLDRFLTQLDAVDLGKTPIDEWRTRVDHDRYLREVVDPQSRTSGIGWKGENSLLSRLHLAPRTVVDASVGFKDGMASSIFIVTGVARRDEKGNWQEEKTAIVRQDISKSPGDCQKNNYTVDIQKRQVVGYSDRVFVKMDSCVFPEDRAKALAINAGCLTKIGGCKTVEEILPRVFGSR